MPLLALKSRAYLLSLLAVFALAAGIRVAHVIQCQDSPFANFLVLDERYNDSLARMYMTGRLVGPSATYQDPLYAYFLGGWYWMFGTGLPGVRVSQAVMGVLTSWVAAETGDLLAGPWVGLAAGALYAGYGPELLEEGFVAKTPLQVLMGALFLYFMYAAKERESRGAKTGGWWLGAGVWLGLGLMLRGNLRAVAPVALWWAGWAGNPFGTEGPGRRPLLKPAWNPLLLFAFGFVMVVWQFPLANYKASGEWVFGANCVGQNLYLGNYRGNQGGGFEPPSWLRAGPDFEETDFRQEAEKRAGHPMTTKQSSDFWTREAIREVLADPLHFILLLGKKARTAAYYFEQGDTASLYFQEKFVPVLNFTFGFGFLAPLAAAGICLSRAFHKKFILLYVCSVAYAASLMLTFILPRYRLSLLPWLVIPAGVALVEGFRLAKDNHWRALALPLGVATLVAVGVNFPRKTPNLGMAWFNAGSLYMDAGDVLQAERAFRHALEEQPGYLSALLNLGVLAEDRGEPSQALSWFRQAAEAHPDAPEPSINIINVLMGMEHYSEAMRVTNLLLTRFPDQVEGHYLRGRLLAATGSGGQSVADLQFALAMKPRPADLEGLLGSAHEQGGRLTQAELWYRKGMKDHPDNPSLEFRLGKVLEKEGRLTEARAAWEAVAREFPTSGEGILARQNLERTAGK